MSVVATRHPRHVELIAVQVVQHGKQALDRPLDLAAEHASGGSATTRLMAT